MEEIVPLNKLEDLQERAVFPGKKEEDGRIESIL